MRWSRGKKITIAILATLTVIATLAMFAFWYAATLTPGENEELGGAGAITMLLAIAIGLVTAILADLLD